jgi:hypothetical protein
VQLLAIAVAFSAPDLSTHTRTSRPVGSKASSMTVASDDALRIRSEDSRSPRMGVTSRKLWLTLTT